MTTSLRFILVFFVYLDQFVDNNNMTDCRTIAHHVEWLVHFIVDTFRQGFTIPTTLTGRGSYPVDEHSRSQVRCMYP